MKDRPIVFTFSKARESRPSYLLTTKSHLADHEDRVHELSGIDFCFWMKKLSKKYNDRGIAVIFDYED